MSGCFIGYHKASKRCQTPVKCIAVMSVDLEQTEHWRKVAAALVHVQTTP